MCLLNREDERLKTFNCWPLSYPDPKTMAAVGLYYTGVGDVTRCYFCKVAILHWERTDSPVVEHLRWSYGCPLMRRRITNNVPIKPKILDLLIPELVPDVCGNRSVNNISALFMLIFTFITFHSVNKIFKK